MKTYKSYGSKPPRGNGGGRDFKDTSFKNFTGKKQGFKATCSQCGESCEVPFRPTNGKPVYCDNCFRSGDHDNESYSKPSRSFDRSSDRNFDRPQSGGATSPAISKELEKINKKLDNILAILAEVIDDEEFEDEDEE